MNILVQIKAETEHRPEQTFLVCEDCAQVFNAEMNQNIHFPAYEEREYYGI